MKPVRLHAQEIKAVLRSITGNVSANSYRGGGYYNRGVYTEVTQDTSVLSHIAIPNRQSGHALSFCRDIFPLPEAM